MLTTPATVCLAPVALLPRGTGSKRKHIQRWKELLGSHPFDTVVEAFGQGLWITQALHQAKGSTLERIIAAEAMVDMRSIWTAWANPEWRPAIDEDLSRWQCQPIEQSWSDIKVTWEACQASGELSALAAAAGFAVRILTFSGICRDTPGSKQLNIKWNRSQLRRWFGTPDLPPDHKDYRAAYKPVWPKTPPSKFDIYVDYGVLRYPADTSNTLALIDPPYVGSVCDPPPTRRSERYLDPSYFGHRPHAQFTYDMAVWSTRAALAAGCRTVIACNYDSDRLHSDYVALAQEFGYSCDRTVIGRLSGLNNNARPVETESPYEDTYWVFTQTMGE